jgi:hypothetical protein
MVMGLFSAFGNTSMTALVAFENPFIPIGISVGDNIFLLN